LSNNKQFRKIKEKQNIDNKKKIKSKKEDETSIKTNKTSKIGKSRFGLYMKIFVFLILGVFLYFAVVSTSNSYKGSVFQRLDILKQKKLPYLVVIRDDFSAVSDENKKTIDNIIKVAEDSLTVFEISYNPKNMTKESKYFIDKFDIESLPVIILCDEKGELINSYYLPLNDKQILGSVEKARESSVN
jgi:hypothetical protein